MNELQKLKGMRRLLSKPERWTKEKLARDKNGRACRPNAKEAVCFCLYGAGDKVAPLTGTDRFIIRAIQSEFPRSGGMIATFNDAPHREHEHILRVLDRAIKNAAVQA